MAALPLRAKNLRTARYLVGWIALLMTASLIVIWTRN
jgi:hypothetical protein